MRDCRAHAIFRVENHVESELGHFCSLKGTKPVLDRGTIRPIGDGNGVFSQELTRGGRGKRLVVCEESMGEWGGGSVKGVESPARARRGCGACGAWAVLC